MARGGGSIEDLWAFNDERVVRAVAGSIVPIISGVGHETDFTLSDFAADLRAPTPTAAAELATPITAADLEQNLRTLGSRLSTLLLAVMNERRSALSGLREGLRFLSPLHRIQSDRQHLDELARRTNSVGAHRHALETSRLEGLENRLEALNPVHILARGYALVTLRKDGAVINRVAQARDEIRIRVSDGEFDARVINRDSRIENSS